MTKIQHLKDTQVTMMKMNTIDPGTQWAFDTIILCGIQRGSTTIRGIMIPGITTITTTVLITPHGGAAAQHLCITFRRIAIIMVGTILTIIIGPIPVTLTLGM